MRRFFFLHVDAFIDERTEASLAYLARAKGMMLLLRTLSKLGSCIYTVFADILEETMSCFRLTYGYGMIVHSYICDDSVHDGEFSILW